MKIQAILFCFLFLGMPVQAMEWSAVLRTLPQSEKTDNTCSNANSNQALCDNPVKEICSDPQTQDFASATDAMRTRLANRKGQSSEEVVANKGQNYLDALMEQEKAQDAVNSAPTAGAGLNQNNLDSANKKLDKAIVTLVKQSAATESEILNDYPQSDENLKKIFRDVKNALIAQIKNSSAFNNPGDAANASLSVVVARLNSADLVTTNYFTNPLVSLTKKAKLAQVFNDSCGEDGLAANAAYDSTTNSMSVCPGMILKALQTGDLTSLTGVIGKELGHAINSDLDMVPGFHPLSPPATTKASYGKYLGCLKDNYFSAPPKDSHLGLSTFAQSRDAALAKSKELGDQITIMNGKLQALDASSAQAPAGQKTALLMQESQLQQEQNEFDRLARQYDRSYQNATNRGARPENILDEQTGQLESELEESVAISTKLKSMQTLPPNKKGDFVKASLQYLCPASAPAESQMSGLFLNPDVQTALQCAGLTKIDHPWCDLSGPVFPPAK